MRALALLLLSGGAALAAHPRWEGGFDFGGGRTVGQGADTYDTSPAAVVRFGAMLHPRLGVFAHLTYQWVRLEEARGLVDGDGWFGLALVAPEIHPFGDHRGWRPFLGPVAGAGRLTLRTSFDGSSVRTRQWGWYAGGQAGVAFRVVPGVWLGPAALIAVPFPVRECSDFGTGVTACSEDPERLEQAFYHATLSLRVAF